VETQIIKILNQDFVQKKLEFQPKGTATLRYNYIATGGLQPPYIK